MERKGWVCEKWRISVWVWEGREMGMERGEREGGGRKGGGISNWLGLFAEGGGWGDRFGARDRWVDGWMGRWVGRYG